LERLPEDDLFLRDLATWILAVPRPVDGDLAASTQTLDQVARASHRAGNVMFAVMALCNAADLRIKQGRLDQAQDIYQRALEWATDERGRPLPIAGKALIGLGELSYQWNDLETAAHYVAQGIELAEQWGAVGAMHGYIVLAYVRHARGDLDGAWEATRKARDLAERFDITEIDDLAVALVQARLRIAQGDLKAARRWAEERELYQYIDAAPQQESQTSVEHRLLKYELIVLARLLIAQGRIDETLPLLESLLPMAERHNRPEMVIEIYLLRALALQAQDNLDRAMASLERALSLAEAAGYVRIFVEEGEPMARLLYLAAERGIAPEYAGRLLAAFPELEPAAQEPQAEMVEPLSERELDILRLIAEGLPNQEIAQSLFLSLSTVKWHAGNIYGKLGVSNRTQAVAKARSLGILPGG
jgi:LuxR family maltose regulon positive regulatory protein